MAVKITGVMPSITQPANATKENLIKAHLDMEKFLWIDEQDQQSGTSTRETMYDWIVNKKGKAYVLNQNNGERVYVFGAISPDGQKYIRTAQNGKWSNLLIDLEKQTKPTDAE